MSLLRAKGVFVITLALVFPLILLVFLFFIEIGFFLVSLGVLNKAFTRAVLIANSAEFTVGLNALFEELSLDKIELANLDSVSSFIFGPNASVINFSWPVSLPENMQPCFSLQGSPEYLVEAFPVRFRAFLIAFLALIRRRHPFTTYLGRFCTNRIEDCVVCLAYRVASDGMTNSCDNLSQLQYVCWVDRPTLLGIDFLWGKESQYLTLSNSLADTEAELDES
jgi:hypothetical protein